MQYTKNTVKKNKVNYPLAVVHQLCAAIDPLAKFIFFFLGICVCVRCESKVNT